MENADIKLSDFVFRHRLGRRCTLDVFIHHTPTRGRGTAGTISAECSYCSIKEREHHASVGARVYVCRQDPHSHGLDRNASTNQCAVTRACTKPSANLGHSTSCGWLLLWVNLTVQKLIMNNEQQSLSLAIPYSLLRRLRMACVLHYQYSHWCDLRKRQFLQVHLSTHPLADASLIGFIWSDHMH